VIRISKLTDYGVVILTHIAGGGGESPVNGRDIAGSGGESPLNARDIAAGVQLPAPTVSKILKVLSREGILISHRGAKGGYTLSAQADQITVAEIIGALEGPISMTECTIFGSEECGHQNGCPVSANWQIINHAVAKALSGITLADMMLPALGGMGDSGLSGKTTDQLNVIING